MRERTGSLSWVVTQCNECRLSVEDIDLEKDNDQNHFKKLSFTTPISYWVPVLTGSQRYQLEMTVLQIQCGRYMLRKTHAQLISVLPT
jgi:hypothetical protein